MIIIILTAPLSIYSLFTDPVHGFQLSVHVKAKCLENQNQLYTFFAKEGFGQIILFRENTSLLK